MAPSIIDVSVTINTSVGVKETERGFPPKPVKFGQKKKIFNVLEIIENFCLKSCP